MQAFGRWAVAGADAQPAPPAPVNKLVEELGGIDALKNATEKQGDRIRYGAMLPRCGR